MSGQQVQMSTPAPVTHTTVFQSNSHQTYRTCGNTMNAVTAAYLVAYVHLLGYLALFIYQLCVAIKVGTEIFGGVVYLPCVFTSLFLIGSIFNFIATKMAISNKEPEWLSVSILFVFSTIIYALYLSIFTILSYSTEGRWLNYMRVQLESKPRFVTGLPTEYSAWKYFQLDAMTDRFILFAVLFMSVVLFDYSSFTAILACQAYLSDQIVANVSTTDQAASQPLIQQPVEPTAPSVKIEMQPANPVYPPPSYGQGVALQPSYKPQSDFDRA